MWHVWKRREIDGEFCLDSLKERDHTEDVDEYKILLQYTVEFAYNVITRPAIPRRYKRGTWCYGKQWRINWYNSVSYKLALL